MRVLDLGCGPGFSAIELARVVAPSGSVLALDASERFIEMGRKIAAEAELKNLEFLQLNLERQPVPGVDFDRIWCRWLVMFLSSPEALLSQLRPLLKPKGQVIFHEYVHWDTFGLHPHGYAISRFGHATQKSFELTGGDANVNRRLPTLLTDQGFHIDDLQPLPVLGGQGSMAALWLERFVEVYGKKLKQQGLWDSKEHSAAQAEINAAKLNPGSFWVGPTVMELRATRLED